MNAYGGVHDRTPVWTLARARWTSLNHEPFGSDGQKTRASKCPRHLGKQRYDKVQGRISLDSVDVNGKRYQTCQGNCLNEALLGR